MRRLFESGQGHFINSLTPALAAEIVILLKKKRRYAIVQATAKS